MKQFSIGNGELRARRDVLELLWKQGLSGRALLTQHTRLMDAFLHQCFLNCPEAREGFALVALGGYGRCELFPFSDIDLMVLHAPGMEDKLAAVTNSVFYPLWDAGLEVGHSVRTPAACLADAGKDFLFQVALLDARLVAGCETLFSELVNSCRKEFIEGRRRDFLQSMQTLRLERHARYGLHSYLLEPHITEGRGGLRDIQAMLWTAKVLFGLNSCAALMQAGLLTSGERQNFEQAWDNLTRIRNQLHYLSGRKNDQLFFEHQEELAQIFAYHSANSSLPVELFMREVYSHLQTIAVTTDLFFEHGEEVQTSLSNGILGKSLEKGIEQRQHHLHLLEADQLERKSQLLIRIFVQSARTGTPIHHRTRKLIAASLHLVDERLRRSRRLAKGLLEIITETAAPLPVLTAMLETGFLPAYLPEFRQVESLAQHDLYHVFTVDRHLLQTVAELARLREEEPQLSRSISSPHVLALAALLHDIGKGQDANHAEQGAVLVQAIGTRLGLAAADISCLVFLVRHHLFLTEAALRRDLEDAAFIIRCARKIADPDRLTMLYLLSIADARATGPAAWNDWKAALLLELFLKLAHLLEDGGFNQQDLASLDHAQGEDWMREQVARLLAPAETALLPDLPGDYLLSFSPQTIAHHIRLRPRLQELQALVVPSDEGDCWSVLVMARDRPGLLAKICGTLALHGLDVMAAQIFTWPDQTAVDVLQVQAAPDSTYAAPDSTYAAPDSTYAAQDWPALERELNLVLNKRLALTHRLVEKKRLGIQRRSGRSPRSSRPRVIIDNQGSDNFTIIEVHAEDRSGLLYDITNTLADLAIDIHRAKVATLATQSVDVFYVLDSNGRRIEDTAFQQEISTALLFIADSGAAGRP
jgi:[protein-PII] uridylyltransferase